MVNQALAELSSQFEASYADTGRPSVAPEKLLRASLLQIFYSIRSERLLVNVTSLHQLRQPARVHTCWHVQLRIMVVQHRCCCRRRYWRRWPLDFDETFGRLRYRRLLPQGLPTLVEGFTR